MKEIVLMFYSVNPSEKNKGMKFVLWEVTDADNKVIYDWGLCEWDGKEWGKVDVPEGYTAKVVRWANSPHPDTLMASKIIF